MSQAEPGRVIFGLLDEAYRGGFTIASDYARRNAENVAAAASLGLITTNIEQQTYGRTWRITAKGLRWLNEHKETK